MQSFVTSPVVPLDIDDPSRPPAPVLTAVGPVVEAVWAAGPDAGGTVALVVGEHIVGRSPLAAVHCGDPALELHHALLTVTPTRSIVRQLAGVAPIAVDDAACEGECRIEMGQRIQIGSSVLVLRHPVSVVCRPDAGEASDVPVAFVRSPRSVAVFTPRSLEVPRLATPPSGIGGGLLPTVLGVAGAAALALLFHQVMFLLFGLMGALVAIGTWVAQRVGLVRSRSGVERANRAAADGFASDLRNECDRARETLLDRTPTIDRALVAMAQRSTLLWSTRATDPDAFDVAIGLGEGFWQPAVVGVGNASADIVASIDACSRLGVVPITASLAAGSVTAVVGDGAACAAVRAMLVQLAAASGPADWQLAIVTDRRAEWDALRGLAHVVDPDGGERIVPAADVAGLVGGLDPDDRRRLVIMVDGAGPLESRTSPLRRFLSTTDRDIACVVVCATETDVPAIVTSSLTVGRASRGRWIRDVRVSALAEPVHVAGISARRAAAAVSALGHLVDPEQLDAGSGLEHIVRLDDLLAVALDDRGDHGADATAFGTGAIDSTRIADRWIADGTDPAARTPLGRDADGVVEVDLVRDGPHALMAGTTGAGKSELLRSLVIGLAALSSPEHVSFVLIDYKGGATFDACVDLPHVVGVVTDLDDRLAERALRSLDAELRRRERVLRDLGVPDLVAHRRLRADDPSLPALPRLVVVIDEFATFAAQLPEFMRALLGIAQRGRSLGVHLVLATQRPGGVVTDDIRANTNLRIALRVQDASDAMDVIGDAAAARLPRNVPGRAVMRLGADAPITFQTACTSDPRQLVAAVREAVGRLGIRAPHRPWREPLISPTAGTVLDPTGVAGGGDAIGIVDDVDAQVHRPLTWSAADGHLLLVGAPGTGTSTALLALGVALDRTVGERELFVLDALGDGRLATLSALACCRSVVRAHERERTMRLLDHLCRMIATRKADAGSRAVVARSEVVVLVDGLGALRADLEQEEQWDQLAQLDTIVAEGLAVGVRVAATATRAGAVPNRLLTQMARRWVFHLADALDASLLGAPPRRTPGGLVGRLYDTASGCEAQIVAPRLPAAPATEASASVIRQLPISVDTAVLPDAAVIGDDVMAPIAIAFDTLLPALLPIAAGEHALVIGPSRSGRTTALRTITERWLQARPDGWVGSVAPRRSGCRVGDLFDDVPALLAAAPADRSVLVVIDDAELVEDPAGMLAARITSRGERFTVLAAGRPEALRASYGHWTAAVRRSRLGLVMSAANELDADLLGIVLPRRLPIAVRPGLAWLVAEGDRRLVQVAQRVEPAV
ncbi:MAG: putative FtsK/SpoIIIE family protein [Ilumatobacteraceae bacterium]|nr:putative FtsK/SpoIIIE family protein [Ilumatobacteraceae bacterium]